MVYRIAGGIAFLLLGLALFVSIPPIITAIFCVVAGVALLAGQ